jgi:hypothetical protein
MSRTDDIHRKQQEVEEINRDMRGINPKLGWYKELSDKRGRLEEELRKLELDGVV